MGMGWPQQLDVRLDGKLLKRFIVGGKAPGTPAAASYAGDGEPGFAGAPEWETYMQLTGDAGLEVRVPVTAGPRVVGVSFVRELWEPEGLPQPLQRGRVLTNDQIYMGYAAVGAVADRRAVPRRRHGDRTRRAAARSSSAEPNGPPADDAPARTKILSRMARLAYRRPVTKADLRHAARVLRERPARGRQRSTPASSSRSSGCWSIRISCCAFSKIRRPHPARRPRRAA